MARRWAARAACIVVAFSASCEGAEIADDGDAAVTPPPPGVPPPRTEPVPARELCSELATVWCEARARCCSDPGVATMEDCLDRTAVGCTQSVGRVLTDPVVSYDAQVAREAVEEARGLAAGCDTGIADFVGTREGVLRVLRGSNGRGRPCAIAYDDLAGALSCTAGNVCHIDSLLPLATSCGPISGAGGPCHIDLECETGLYCRGAGVIRGTCATVLPDGAPCARWQECASFVCEMAAGRDQGTCVERTGDGIYCTELFSESYIAGM
ncbi:MAG: hypothetical protein IT379_15350 [Deltaproteobacteria bacterium]|nr:hypothetical protein [Deltaproteobacteria bacterium]